MSSNEYELSSAKFLCDLTLEGFSSTDCSGTESGIVYLGYGFYREKACATSIAHSIAAVAAVVVFVVVAVTVLACQTDY
jgi:hypothetical protein